MNIEQIESSFSLILPDLVALLATLADSTDTGDVMLVKHISSLQTRLTTLRTAVEALQGSDKSLAQQLDQYDTFLRELQKRNSLLRDYTQLPVFKGS